MSGEKKVAKPVQVGDNKWICDQCGHGCYYDGRMGDGPILMCKCNEAWDYYWSKERR